MMTADIQMMVNKVVMNPYGFKPFINGMNELIIDRPLNIYFNLTDIETIWDFKAKVLEFVSFYCADNHNMGFLKKSKNVEKLINYILDTNFTHEDFQYIYMYLGNRCNHQRTIAFINSNYDMNLLRDLENKIH